MVLSWFVVMLVLAVAEFTTSTYGNMTMGII